MFGFKAIAFLKASQQKLLLVDKLFDYLSVQEGMERLEELQSE